MSISVGAARPAAAGDLREARRRYLHQCFMVGTYEPYVGVCRRLSELFPGSGVEYESVLLDSGAEAVKIARAASGRPAVIALDRGFHGRTLLTMSMTSKVVPCKRGFGPFAPEVYRAPAPYEYRGIGCVGDVRGLGPMLALELVRGRHGAAPAPELAAATVAQARERGLLPLACGTHGNVIRLLPPVTIGDADLAEGLDALEAALRAAGGSSAA